MSYIRQLAKISFHLTSPERVNRKEWWMAYIFPIFIGMFLSAFPILLWETAFFLVIAKVLPLEIMTIVNYFIEFLVALAFGVPILYTYIVTSIKRLHDLGHTGWWWLFNLMVIPIPAFILYLGFTKSKHCEDVSE